MSFDSTMATTAAHQGGVITRSQAIRLGMTTGQIDRRVQAKRWKPLVHGGYQIFEMPGKLNLLRAAVTLLPSAVASHYSAAAIHKLNRLDTSRVTVLVHSQTTHAFPGVKVFRCHDLDTAHVVEFGGIRVTTPARTITDLSPLITPTHLGVVLDDAVAARTVTCDQVRLVLDSVARKGKPGVRNLRAVLDERHGPTRPQSALEIAGNQLLVGAGISGFVIEHAIPWAPTKRFDVAFPPKRLAIEWDSRRWHTQVEAFRSDRARDRDAVLHGWRVLRFTWDDVHKHPTAVVDTVKSALDM